MMDPVYRSLLVLLCILGLAHQVKAQSSTNLPERGFGVILDDAAYEGIPMSPTFRGDAYTDLPSSFTLKAFAPFAGDQGTTNSCVGWATSYAARTIAEAVARGWADRAFITDNAFSPSFVYNQLQVQYENEDPKCSVGAVSAHALQLLKEVGTRRISDFPFSCSLIPTDQDIDAAKDNVIFEYSRLFETNQTSKVKPVRKSIAEKKPVVIVMNIPESLFSSYGKADWLPIDLNEKGQGWHAMTVVGYDDDRNNGSFEIMNSWGQQWGDDGFIWVPYEAFSSYVRYAYDVHVQKDNELESLSGEVTLRLADETHVDVYQGERAFHSSAAFVSGTTLSLELESTTPAYVYILGSDRTREISQLFPHENKGESAFLGFEDRNAIELPRLVMNEQLGEDYLSILLSKKEIDLKETVRLLNQVDGYLPEQLATHFSEGINDPRFYQLKSDGSISFSSGGYSGDIMAVTYAIRHVDETSIVDDESPEIKVLSPPSRHFDSIGGVESVLLPQSSVTTVLLTATDDGEIDRVEASSGTVARKPDGITLEWTIGTDLLRADVQTILISDRAGNTSTHRIKGVTSLLPPFNPVLVVMDPQVSRVRAERELVISDEFAVEGTLRNLPQGASAYLNGNELATQQNGAFEVVLSEHDGSGRLDFQFVDKWGQVVNETLYVQDDAIWAGAKSREYEEYIEMDVFYGTDRARTGYTEPVRFYGGKPNPNLEVGVARVSIPATHARGFVEKPRWWKFEFSAEPGKHFVLQSLEPLGIPNMRERLRSAVAQNDENSAFVFVHGYKTSFEDAIFKTAQLAYDLYFTGIPILYSWPSDNQYVKYASDREDAVNSARRLESFLQDVVRNSGAERVHLIAHSMGAQALVKALMTLRSQRNDTPIEHIVLAAPDIGVEDFTSTFVPRLAGIAENVTVYASSSDKALILSEVVNGSPRVGDSRNGIRAIEGVDMIDVQAYDTSMLGMGHSYYSSVEPVVQDMAGVILRDVPVQERPNLTRKEQEAGHYWILSLFNN